MPPFPLPTSVPVNSSLTDPVSICKILAYRVPIIQPLPFLSWTFFPEQGAAGHNPRYSRATQLFEVEVGCFFCFGQNIDPPSRVFCFVCSHDRFVHYFMFCKGKSIVKHRKLLKNAFLFTRATLKFFSSCLMLRLNFPLQFVL